MTYSLVSIQCWPLNTGKNTELRPCLHGVGDPGLVGYVLCPPERENKRKQPH